MTAKVKTKAKAKTETKARSQAGAKHQAELFSFSGALLVRARDIIARYPENCQQSAVIPLLTMAQEQCGGWLPQTALDEVAAFLNMETVRVYEVASFYTMFNLNPVGQHIIEICHATPCWLRGSDKLTAACEAHLGINRGETSEDGLFTLRGVECLGACANGPVARINNQYYEDLDADHMVKLLESFARGETPPNGSQTGRRDSCPICGKNKMVVKTESAIPVILNVSKKKN